MRGWVGCFESAAWRPSLHSCATARRVEFANWAGRAELSFAQEACGKGVRDRFSGAGTPRLAGLPVDVAEELFLLSLGEGLDVWD